MRGLALVQIKTVSETQLIPGHGRQLLPNVDW